MRILMISNHLGVQSGVQRYVQNLLLHLDTAKYRVTLFVGQCPPDQASTAPALEAHGVEILAVPDNKKDRIRALAAHLRTHKDYDIIHYHTASKIGAPVCGMMRVLCPRAKIVVHSHIVYPPMTLTWRAAHLVYQLFADYFLGCGVAAGRFVFGDHIDRRPNFSVACNANAVWAGEPVFQSCRSIKVTGSWQHRPMVRAKAYTNIWLPSPPESSA